MTSQRQALRCRATPKRRGINSSRSVHFSRLRKHTHTHTQTVLYLRRACVGCICLLLGRRDTLPSPAQRSNRPATKCRCRDRRDSPPALRESGIGVSSLPLESTKDGCKQTRSKEAGAFWPPESQERPEALPTIQLMTKMHKTRAVKLLAHTMPKRNASKQRKVRTCEMLMDPAGIAQVGNLRQNIPRTTRTHTTHGQAENKKRKAANHSRAQHNGHTHATTTRWENCARHDAKEPTLR